MILYFALLYLLSSPEPWHFPETEIWHYLSNIQVVVTEAGDVFMLDSKDARLLHFNTKGQRFKDAAVKGSGPGELNHANRMEYFDGSIIVYDLRKIHLFSPTGSFIETLDRPGLLLSCKRVKVGWVGLLGLQYGQKDKPLQLLFYNEDFTESKILGNWASEKERRGKNMPPRFNPAEAEFYVNPAEDFNRVVRSQDGQYIYFHPAYIPSIYKFDLDSGKQVGEIKFEGDRIPFNEEWGEQYVKHRSNNSRNIKFKPWLPAFFPDIQYMTVSLDNHLVYRKWLPVPSNPEDLKSFHTKDHWISIDENGKQISSTLMDQYVTRVVAVRGDTVWFTYTTEEGEHTVARCPKNKAADFLAAKMEFND